MITLPSTKPVFVHKPAESKACSDSTYSQQEKPPVRNACSQQNHRTTNPTANLSLTPYSTRLHQASFYPQLNGKFLPPPHPPVHVFVKLIPFYTVKHLFGLKGLVSWCFEPSQPQRIISGLSLKGNTVFVNNTLNKFQWWTRVRHRQIHDQTFKKYFTTKMYCLYKTLQVF